MSLDPVETNPTLYSVLFENDRVRVMTYADEPGEKSTPHKHPDSVMVTLSAFRRRLAVNGSELDVELPSGAARWLPAQSHTGENIGDTETHAIFIELKEPRPGADASPSIVQQGDLAAHVPLGPN